MKIVIAGGTGLVGKVLCRGFYDHGLVVLSRQEVHSRDAKFVRWDGESLGPWVEELEGADVVINLAGRSVNCRYTAENLKAMMDSRVLSTRVIGQAIAQCPSPPKTWLQASTATIYAHTFGEAHDEQCGIIGGGEPGAPHLWDKSIQIAKNWEHELFTSSTPTTRKVAMRTAIVIAPDRGCAFDAFAQLASFGLGGKLGDGKQWMSWIHESDFVNAVKFLIAHSELEGCINIASPNPVIQAEFARGLREALGITFGLPSANWMVELGTRLKGTESELVLKSRRVVPGVLLKAGFEFEYPRWSSAAEDLVERWKRGD